VITSFALRHNSIAASCNALDRGHILGNGTWQKQ